MTVRKSLAFSLFLVLVPLLDRAAQPAQSGKASVFGYADFTKRPRSKRNSSPCPTPNSPAKS